jgi:hypothetical protein
MAITVQKFSRGSSKVRSTSTRLLKSIYFYVSYINIIAQPILEPKKLKLLKHFSLILTGEK